MHVGEIPHNPTEVWKPAKWCRHYRTVSVTVACHMSVSAHTWWEVTDDRRLSCEVVSNCV